MDLDRLFTDYYNIQDSEELRDETNEDKANFFDLFHPLKICTRTITMFYNWFVSSLCYYGLTMTASNLSEHLFLDYTLIILIEVPALFFLYFMMIKVGRKTILAGCQIMSGTSCIIAGFLYSYPELQVRALISNF